mmetsp:Transcript_11729/g.8553  ORF Transcript_11729/g.8553 Transcript_11729/m.8553 type:complete len:130 (+) Transcript_11729:269-658(+)
MDQKVRTVERKRYTILDALSATGGIIGILFGGLNVLLAFIKRAQMTADLLYASYTFDDTLIKKQKSTKLKLEAESDIERSTRQLNMDGKTTRLTQMLNLVQKMKNSVRMKFRIYHWLRVFISCPFLKKS